MTTLTLRDAITACLFDFEADDRRDLGSAVDFATDELLRAVKAWLVHPANAPEGGVVLTRLDGENEANR